MKKLVLIFILFSSLGFGVNTEKLLSSQKYAQQNYKKSSFLAKELLESAGIEELINKGIPKALSKTQYVSILNDYAFYQMECKNYDKSIEILNLVLEKDYKRAVAHYNLGECYLYKASENNEDEELNLVLAKSSFSSYVKLLKKDAKIPQKVKDTLGKDFDLLLNIKNYDSDSKVKMAITKKLENLYNSDTFLISFVIPSTDKSKKIVLVEGLYPCNGLYIYEKGSLTALEIGVTKLLYFIKENYLVFHSSSIDYGLQTDKYYALDINNKKTKLLYLGLSDVESGGFGRGQEIGIDDYALDSIILKQEDNTLKLNIIEENKSYEKRKLNKIYQFDKKGIREIE